MTTFHDFTATQIDGRERNLAEYAGKVVLVVNTATQCGFAPQLTELEELQQRHGEDGLVVLGFPCNQFAHQEPGDAQEVAETCSRNYGVTFQLFDKIDVNGARSHPLYAWLRSQRGGVLGNAIKWNFTKFLIAPDGTVIDRYAPKTRPLSMEGDITEALRSVGGGDPS